MNKKDGMDITTTAIEHIADINSCQTIIEYLHDGVILKIAKAKASGTYVIIPPIGDNPLYQEARHHIEEALLCIRRAHVKSAIDLVTSIDRQYDVMPGQSTKEVR